jgi:hypothetical protein
MHYACRICNSEHKKVIEDLLSKKIRYRDIARKFINGFDCDLHLLEQSIASHKNHIEKELSDEEIKLLDRIKNGEIELNEISRIVAAKVFEKMLKNPNDWHYLDFFRIELLKIKQEETQLKENWAKELVNRMFMGKLPPQYCPKCGYNLSEYSSQLQISDI